MENQKNYLKISSDADCKNLIWDQTDKKFSVVDKKFSPIDLRKKIEPWLTALFQSERLNLLIGSGLTISLESLAAEKPAEFMKSMEFDVFSAQIQKATKKSSTKWKKIP